MVNNFIDGKRENFKFYITNFPFLSSNNHSILARVRCFHLEACTVYMGLLRMKMISATRLSHKLLE